MAVTVAVPLSNEHDVAVVARAAFGTDSSTKVVIEGEAGAVARKPFLGLPASKRKDALSVN